jgi:hypothetical protein
MIKKIGLGFALVFSLIGIASAQVNPGVRIQAPATVGNCVQIVNPNTVAASGAPCGGGGGSGTVTSVGITGTSGITTSGTNPVTTSGNIGVAVDPSVVGFLGLANAWTNNQTLTGDFDMSVGTTNNLTLRSGGRLTFSGATFLTSNQVSGMQLGSATGSGSIGFLMGGTTNAFPAIRRNGTTIDITTANNATSYAPVHSSSLIAEPTGQYIFDTSTRLMAPSDGLLRLSNSAQTDFSRLQLGGTTALFPAIKRNLTALNFRLADDSADAPITAGNTTVNNLTINGTCTGCPGGGAGTVTSVGITTGGSDLAITGSPVTTSGNINVNVSTGTSGASIPRLNGANTWTNTQTFTGPILFSGVAPSMIAGCTGGTISGVDVAAHVAPTNSWSSCTIRFNGTAFTNPPICVATPDTSGQSISMQGTTGSQFIVSKLVTAIGGFYYTCVGY